MTERKPLEVELYVCPVEDCLKVGKLPQGLGSRYAAFCVGPAGTQHKRKKMVMVPFHGTWPPEDKP